MHSGTDKTRIGRLIRNFVAIAVGNYGALLAAFAISIVLTRRLGVELFGRLSFLLMVSQVGMLIVGNWTQVGFVRFAAQEFSSRGTVADIFWARTCIVAPVLGASVLIFGAIRAPFAAYLVIPEWGLALILGHFLLSYAMMNLSAIFQARQDMTRYGMMMFCDKAISLGLVTALPSTWIVDPLSVLACYTLSTLAIFLWGVWMLGVRTFLPVSFDREACRAFLKLSSPFILTSWLGLFGATWVDFVLLKWLRSVSEVGLYALANQLAGVVQQVTIAFSTLALPHYSVLVASGQQERIKTLLERFLPYWLIATSTVFCLALIGAGPVLPIVFGSAFEQAYPALAVLMVASSALALYNALDPLATAFGKTWVLARICLGSVLLKVLLAPPFIYVWGIRGAALSTVCSYWFSALWVLRLVKEQTHVSLFQMTALTFPVMVVCVSVLHFGGRDLNTIALAVGGLSLYLSARRLRLFEERDRLFFRDLRKGLMRELEIP